MSTLLRYVLLALFAVFLATASAAAEAHRGTYQGEVQLSAASELGQRSCDGSCDHGSAICVQLCLAHSAGLTSEAFEIGPMISKSTRVPKAALLLTGLVSPPQLLPPIA